MGCPPVFFGTRSNLTVRVGHIAAAPETIMFLETGAPLLSTTVHVLPSNSKVTGGRDCARADVVIANAARTAREIFFMSDILSCLEVFEDSRLTSSCDVRELLRHDAHAYTALANSLVS